MKEDKFEIKTVHYYPLFFTITVLSVFLLLFLIKFKNQTFDISVTLTVFSFLVIFFNYLFRGKFIAEVLPDNVLEINWVKKPFLSNVKNEKFKVAEIIDIYTPINISHAPDRLVIKLKSERKFSFFYPIFCFKNEVVRLEANLNAIRYTINNKL